MLPGFSVDLLGPKGTKVIVTENQETYVSFPKK